jgi:dUTP pyrophosphatase
MEVPTGHVGLLFPRSSNSKMDLLLSNSVGVIDEDYRGEVQARFKDTFMPRGLFVGMESGIEPKYYKKGDAVCQLIIIPVSRYEAMWVEELSVTVRGDGGFGSTNK